MIRFPFHHDVIEIEIHHRDGSSVVLHDSVSAYSKMTFPRPTVRGICLVVLTG